MLMACRIHPLHLRRDHMVAAFVLLAMSHSVVVAEPCGATSPVSYQLPIAVMWWT